MLDFLKNLDSQTILLILVAIVAIYLLTRKSNSREGFSAEDSQEVIPIVTSAEEVVVTAPVAANVDAASQAGSVVMEKRMSDEEIPIKPTFVDGDVRSLMSGSGFMPPNDVIPAWGMNVDSKYGIVDGLDDGAGGSLGLHFTMTSPACCADQWPVPFKLPYDKFICENKEKFALNPHMGNNSWQNSGCVCMPKKTHEFLVNRGGNA